MARTRNARPLQARHARLVAGVTLALLLLPAVAVRPARSDDATVTTVTVERERPVREKLPTLRFLKANRDFIRGRFDRLRLDAHESAAGAGDLDPRFLMYRRMLAVVATDKDSVTLSSDARERAALFSSVTDLGALERELDQMERLLDAQRARLGVLQNDFAGRQRTELDVLVTGGALAGRLDSVVVTLEDGSRVTSGLNETQRQSLKHGGAFEVFRGLVEPRDQTLEVALVGEGWSAVGHGFITLEPARDRLTFLKLDLAQAHPARGIASVTASTWLLEPEVPTADATRNRP
jgi:hypothetical protein